jgi:predicted dehydrogenase
MEYPTLADGLKAQLIAEAAYESLQTNRPVQIDYWQPS